ncbi:ribulose-phosphate 3-epimerase [Listeria monocytogenes]|uniref:ribulose-phosphate 3-epimerase n=1 Tax=Listeria monocytogenes TaxID=1639 RepID=UPI00083D3EA7|nr:ribulose-phosphate 3-epimerase [Listeria monocytogenes]ODC27560.1 ribulose-phosphate 3-epimerase [Listeria monocytogenes]HAA9305024.1 ribulose phosphate epimerase [Listeria monocytogenes]
MSKKLICPSMMCADFSGLEREVEELDKAGSDVFHVDIMDGAFVPSFGMGLQDFEEIRQKTQKLVDVHLMIMNPGDYVEMFADKGADIIYIHPEADLHPARTLDKIRNKGKKVGIAINPGTAIATIKELLPLVDNVMVMTVNPGFAGQKYLDYVDVKIAELVELKKDYTFEIMVDGAISPEKISKLSQLGVNGFVLGTSALFGKKESYAEIIKKLKQEKMEELR